MRIKKYKYKYRFVEDENDFYLFFKIRIADIKHCFYLSYTNKKKYTVSFICKYKDGVIYEDNQKRFKSRFTESFLEFKDLQNFMRYHLGRDYTQYFPEEIFSVILSKNFI